MQFTFMSILLNERIFLLRIIDRVSMMKKMKKSKSSRKYHCKKDR